MKYEEFRKKVWSHLDKYKKDVLKVNQNVKIDDHTYKHILPKDEKDKNLGLLDCSFERNENILTLPNHAPIKLHTHWNHLSSSQILCISYFAKFINNAKKLDEILTFLGINEKSEYGEFEVIAGEEKTNVDFTIHLKNGKNVYFEIKYTEPEFGAVSSSTDESKYRNYYNDCHKGVQIDWDDYKKHYQIVRNVCLSENGNYTIFLLPRSNDSINICYEKGIRKINNFDKFKNSVKRIMWEDLLLAFPNNGVFEKYFDF